MYAVFFKKSVSERFTVADMTFRSHSRSTRNNPWWI